MKNTRSPFAGTHLLPPSVWCLIACLVLLGLPAGLEAVQIVDYTASVNDRFSSGFPGSPVENSGLFGGAETLDFSGVGWTEQTDHRRHITMISPQHFVAANHFRPAGAVNFLNRDGAVKAFSIDPAGFSTTSLDGKVSDLVVGKLTDPILLSDNISHYPVLDFPHESDFIGTQLMVYGRGATLSDSPRLGANYIDLTTTLEDVSGINKTRVFMTDQDNVSGETQAESGDSGAPSFIFFNGQLTVAGVHFAVYDLPPKTFDSLIWSYQDQLQTILGSDGETLGTVAPEPASATMLLVGFALAMTRRRREAKGK